MKEKIKFFGIIALVAVIGFSMVGCKEDDGTSSLEGTWKKGTDYFIEFTGSNFVHKCGIYWSKGTFTFTSNQITFNTVSTSSDSGSTWTDSTSTNTINYTRNGDKITISGFDGEGEANNGEWTKQ